MPEKSSRVGPIVDFHTYVGRDAYGDHAQTADGLIESLDRYQIEAAVVAPMLDVPGPDNRAHDTVLAAANRYPRRLIPFARLDPRYGEVARRELQSRLSDDGFRGVLFNPVTTQSLCYHDGVLPIMESAAENDVPVLVVTGNHYVGLPEHVGLLASRVPALRIVIGHMGTAAHALRAVSVAERHDNVYLETSLQQSPFRLPFAVARLGEERVLFGSAAPYSHQRAELTKIEVAGLSAEAKRQVLGGNASRLLDLQLNGRTP